MLFRSVRAVSVRWQTTGTLDRYLCACGDCLSLRDRHCADGGRGILENKGDPQVSCSELAAGDYSLKLLAALDSGLSFRGDERPADIAAWRDHAPDLFPLPHPSWRNTAWLKKHPWFERDLLPVLRARVREILDD